VQTIRHCVAPDGAEIAYAVSGGGPALVMAAWWVSDLEQDWENPEWRRFYDRLGAHHTIVRYDKPGMGCSRCDRSSFTTEDEVSYLETVIDAFGADEVALFSMSCGVPVELTYAARNPERVSRIISYAGYADGSDLAPPETMEAIVSLVRSTWGSLGARTMADLFMPNATSAELQDFVRYQRRAAGADDAADLMRLSYTVSAREAVADVACPVLILHRQGDRAVSSHLSRELAESLHDASLVILDGSDHQPQLGDTDALIREIERFLLGHSVDDYATRRLATVLFTDIVGSTTLATELGDDAWRRRLDEHDTITGRAVERHGGRVVKSTGDGVLALFDLPSQALGCVALLNSQLPKAGLEIRAGIHTAEVEMRDDDVAGIAVNVAARVESHAGPGEVLVTSTVRDLSAGGSYRFEEHSTTELKGVDGVWTLYAVT
jgi:class 3 adenylate cyclase